MRCFRDIDPGGSEEGLEDLNVIVVDSIEERGPPLRVQGSDVGFELDEVIDRLQVPLLATSSHASATVHQADLSAPVAWLFGNEGTGVAPELVKRAQQQVAIPMPGGAESLNVAAAAAVCLFEAVRQRSKGGRK